MRPGGNPSHLKQVLRVMEESPGERKTATGPSKLVTRAEGSGALGDRISQ